ncbi:MAG: hypothetical protein AB7Q81_14610 [Gammaproteobacteria bacterium]
MNRPVTDPVTTPCLAQARVAGEDILEALGARCAALGLTALETVAAAGSLGRLEITARSDFDALFVARPAAEPHRVAEEIAAVLDAAGACGLVPPKADGIYRDAITRAALLDRQAHGRLDEAPAVFGKRMQCLLDARPLYGKATFDALRLAVLDWYLGADVDAADLLNDLKRYLHGYAAWQHHKHSRSSTDSWALRQAKLRSVRLLTFAGLLMLLGASSRLPPAGRATWLAARLDATPLERIAEVMEEFDPVAFQRLLADYEFCFARLADPTFRRRLVAAGSDHAALAELTPVTTRLLHELTAFVLARRDEWHADFFSGLVFWATPHS